MVEQSEVPEVGTRVRLVATTWNGPTEVEGVLLAATAAEHITVKLVNGYNATHSLNMVESIIDLGASKSANLDSPEVSMNADLPLIHILHTGGTIASKVDYTTGAVTARFEPEEILAAIPELAEIAQIKTKKLGNMWSDDVRPQHWNRMVEAVATSFSAGAVGVVITHGTDTMHISAAAIAFAFSGTGGRPAGRIALTGSQRSSDRGSTDGAENLIAAVHWAAFGPEPSGVTDSTVVVMHGSGDDGTIAVNPGCAVRKNHSSKRDAFVSINQNPLASISIGRDGINMTLTDSYSNLLSANPRIVNLEPTNFDCDVKIMQLISGPHLQADQIIHAMKNGYQGVLFWGTGLGHLPLDNPGDAPENDEVQDAVSNYIAGGGIAVITTQCISGPVHLDVYSKGRDQQELGILGHGTNFTPEVSMVKLHYLLSLGLKENEISSAWAENLVGENPSSI
jgi:glutamyl-tRNA(Gln) amidotransferase subunit D